MFRALASLLIRTFIPADDREALGGDLEQSTFEIARDRGQHAADRWLAREAAIAAALALRGRVQSLWSGLASFTWDPRDLRLAARGLVRTPGFTAIATASLALGIGATTAMFSLVYAVLYQPIAVPHPEELVVLERLSAGGSDDTFSAQEFAALTTSSARAQLTLDRSIDNVPMTFAADQDFVSTDFVAGDFFRVVGVQPRLGRLINAHDERTGARVLVLSERLWETRLQSDPRAIGSIVAVKGTPFTVIGITPASFRGLDYPGFFAAAMPASAAPAIGLPDHLHLAQRAFSIIARVPASPAERLTAKSSLDVALARCCPSSTSERLSFIEASYGVTSKNDMRSELRTPLLALLASVGLVLVITCVNVATLLLVRGERRARELALRISLGASRARVMGPLLAEGVLLSFAGGALGLVVAAAGRMALSRSLPRNVDVMAEVMRFHFDAPVVLCALAATGFTVILATVAPAWRSSRVSLASTTDGGRATARARGRWPERAAVMVQVALALLLVTTASLLSGTLARLSSVDTGLHAQDVHLLQIETRGTPIETGGMVPIERDILDRIRAVPGVEAAGFATYIPFYGGRRASRDLTLVGTTRTAKGAILNAVTPGFLPAAGITLIAGRGLDTSDMTNGSPVAVLSESAARALGGGTDLVGRQVRLEGQTSGTATVIGIARDTKLNTMRGASPVLFYMPVTQTGEWPFLELAARVPKASQSIDKELRDAVASVAPLARVRFSTTLETELRASLARERFSAALAAVFAVIALVLVGVGLYGLMSHDVARRRSELGVRVALGARVGHLIALVARQSLAPVAAGLVVGLPLAFLAGRLIGPELYGIRSWEPALVILSIGILLATATLAIALPARRAAKTDPLTSLQLR